jgi:hypothetical protein
MVPQPAWANRLPPPGETSTRVPCPGKVPQAGPSGAFSPRPRPQIPHHRTRGGSRYTSIRCPSGSRHLNATQAASGRPGPCQLDGLAAVQAHPAQLRRSRRWSPERVKHCRAHRKPWGKRTLLSGQGRIISAQTPAQPTEEQATRNRQGVSPCSRTGPESAGAADPTSLAARTLNHCTAAIHRRDEPQSVRHQGSQDSSMLHQPSQIPGCGDLLPRFLPKEAT